MWIAFLIAGAVCAFGLLSALSNERAARLQQIEQQMRIDAERAEREAQASKHEEPILVS